jgi:hypothetical protein
MLKKAESNPLFYFPDTPNLEKLKQILIDIANKEIEDCRGSEREQKRCERAVSLTREQPLTSIVVHGVHQFSPVQLRLLLAMEKMGVTVIFLFNYQKKYSRIYSSWNDVYSCFEVPIHHDTVVSEYQLPTMQNPSNALACALGELCEDRGTVGSALLKKWHKLYSSVQLMEFANITEYAHFVSNHFDAAIQHYSDSRSVLDRGNDVWSNAAVLSHLEEQVYTANRDIHTLLKIYYPEYAKDRHFLSYPIGQFFSAIYRLWDYEKGKISFDVGAIKECLSSNILSAAPGEVLLRTFYNVELLFESIETFDDFRREIAEAYVENYRTLADMPGSNYASKLRNLSIYNKYKVPMKDVLALIKAIEEINEIATYLFATDNSHEDFINFGRHFHNLEDFLKQRELTLANEQERALITALQLRLEEIKPEKSMISGTFRDLKEGLHYYLKQKNDDDQGVDWIVKNYEQIDGDILQSKHQFEREQHKVYHFACVSDRDMNMTVNDQLPWPLTDEFIRLSYSPIDLQFQVYYTSLSERSNFLRYALFYGLCYNRCDVRLSYVKQYGDETTEPYTLLSVLGLVAKVEFVDSVSKPLTFSINVPQEVTKGIKYDRYQMMDMFLCPYRFFLDYVMENAPVIKGNFLYQKYFENLLIEAVWKRIGGQKRSDVEKYLDQILNQETAKLAPYFRFWKSTEIFDLRLRAKNYLLHDIITDGTGSMVKQYSPNHMQIRKVFGTAKFVVDVAEVERKNPYTEFEQLAVRNGWKKEYSLHKLPLPDGQPLVDILRGGAKQYLNQSGGNDKVAIPSDWCIYCVHRGTCMESYLRGEVSACGSIPITNPKESSRIVNQIGATIPPAVIVDENDPIVVTVDTSDAIVVPAKKAQDIVVVPEEVVTVSPVVTNESVLTAPVTITQDEIDSTAEEANPKELAVWGEMLAAIKEMVEDNRQEIQALKNDLALRRSRREDTSRIEARLADEERRSQELLEKLGQTETRLASSEANNRTLEHTVKAQDELLEKKKALEFSEEELEHLRKYTTIIVFDTCSIMNYPNLLDGVNDGELVIVPKVVNNELENHKVKHYFDERQKKAQRAISAIFNYKRRFPLEYAESVLDLVPAEYRVNEGEKELNDNKILAVAIRYKSYTDVPVLFITDDKSLANRADGEGIEVWTAQDFLTPPDSSFEEVVDAPEISDEGESGEAKSADEERRKKAQEEFLAQKISAKLLRLESSQISLLQNYGVKTLAQFMSQNEESFSQMRAKNGMSFTAKFLKEQSAIQHKLETL